MSLRVNPLLQLGYLSKLEQRAFFAEKKLGVRIGENKYDLVRPAFAQFNGDRRQLSPALMEVLNRGGRVVIKHASPMSTFGTMTYFLSRVGEKLHLRLPATNETWTGQAAARVLQGLPKKEVADELVPKAYRRQWIAEEDYQPERLDGGIVENRFYVMPFISRKPQTVLKVGYVGEADTRSLKPVQARHPTEILTELYANRGYSPKQAAHLASEWTAAATHIAEEASHRLHKSVSRAVRKPFGYDGFREAAKTKSALLTEGGKTYLNTGYGVDLSPVWNERKKRFDMALAEFQVYPGIGNLTGLTPELRKTLEALRPFAERGARLGRR